MTKNKTNHQAHSALSCSQQMYVMAEVAQQTHIQSCIHSPTHTVLLAERMKVLFKHTVGLTVFHKTPEEQGGLHSLLLSTKQLPTPSVKYICYCQPYRQHIYLQLNTFLIHITCKLCAHTTISTCSPKTQPHATHGRVLYETEKQLLGQTAMEATKTQAPLPMLQAG